MLQYKDNPGVLKEEHRSLIERLTKKRSRVVDSTHFIAWCLDNRDKVAKTNEPITELTTCLLIAQHALRISTFGYYGLSKQVQVVLTSNITQTYRIKQNFDKIIDKVTFSTTFTMPYNLGALSCEAHGNLHLVDIGSNETFVIIHSHLVAVRDLFNAWFDVLLYSYVCRDKYPPTTCTQR